MSDLYLLPEEIELYWSTMGILHRTLVEVFWPPLL